MEGVMSIKVNDTPLTLEEVQAISDCMHGKTTIRFDPDATWTALKKINLLQTIDAELALMKAELVVVPEPIDV
jgi:hypothetical protein